MTATSTDTQIIYGPDGRPAFAVIPFDAYRALVGDASLSDEAMFDLAMAEREEPIPHAVATRLAAGEPPLRVYREWRNLTQAELAEKTGVSTGYISQVERGGRHLSRKARQAAAQALGIDPGDLDA